MRRIALLVCAAVQAVSAVTIIEDPLQWVTRSRVDLVVPDTGEPGYYDSVTAETDETYRFTITGSEGTGIMTFRSLTTSHEVVTEHARWTARAWIESPVLIESAGECSGFACPWIEFTFGEPFDLRFISRSTASFRYFASDPMYVGGGTLTAEASLSIYEIYDMGQTPLNVHITMDRIPTVENPEPGTVGMLLGGILLIVAGRRRLRG
jgi:hypothetical protein